MTSYLRMAAIVLIAFLIFYFLERRYRSVSQFLLRETSALNLAVVRIAVLIAIWHEISTQRIFTFARLDPALLAPPKGWSWAAGMFPRNNHLVEAFYATFVIGVAFALVGLFSRTALIVTAISSAYLLTIPQLFGKVDHYHHLVIFCFLLALYPSADTLSIDSIRRGFKAADKGELPRLAPSRTYAEGLNVMLVLMGIMYFFPGTWKIAESWPHWFSSQNMAFLIYKRMLEIDATPIRAMTLRMPIPLLLSTYAAVAFELSMIFLILWRNSRTVALILGLAFHNLTNLLMAIPFVALQCCYAVFVDWTAVLRFVAVRCGMSPITIVYNQESKTSRRTIAALCTIDWLGYLNVVPGEDFSEVEAKEVTACAGTKMLLPARHSFVYPQTTDSGCEFVEQRMLPGTRFLAGACVSAMIVVGMARIVNAWPLACYPTFAGPASLTIPKLTMQTFDRQGMLALHTLSYDREMEELLGSGRWDGLVQQQIRGTASKASAAALIRVWETRHALGDLSAATLSIDTYVLDLRDLDLRRVGRSELATLHSGDGI